jgi:hypothetical protein
MSKKPTQRQEKAEKKPKKAISGRNGNDITRYQFKKGKPGGPGRPKIRHLRDMLREEIPDTEWLEMIEKTVKRAKEGDTAALKLLMEYRDGKPTQAIEHSGGMGIQIVGFD